MDGGSSDGTPDLVPQDEGLIHSPPGRAVQMNRGASVAHGQILVFCHADSRLPADWRLMYGDQAQSMSRETFQRVGGFPEIPIMEDLEMMRSLHRVGRLVRIPLRVTSSSRRFLERGPLRQLWLNLRVVLRYLLLGAEPEEVARMYHNTARDKGGV